MYKIGMSLIPYHDITYIRATKGTQWREIL